jgi:hypothetical protein
VALLTSATRVADEVGLTRPTALAASSDQLARQMFALANATLEELSEKDWPILVERYEFNTVVDQAEYSLPADFKRQIADTAYLASAYYEMRGSLTPAEWERRRSGLPSYIGRYRYRVFGNPLQLHMTPAPQTVESVVLEYISNKLATDVNGAPVELYTSDTDVSVVPEELVRMGLKWRIKHAKGLDYSEDYNRYDSACKTRMAHELNLGAMPVAQRSYADTPELGDGYVPETGFGG